MRWRLDSISRKHPYGEHSWRDVFEVFHRRGRMPFLPGIGNREVVYARGSRHRIGCWLLVSHRPACRLADVGDGGAAATAVERLLSTRVVVQNLGCRPIELDPSTGLTLHLRAEAGGAVMHPDMAASRCATGPVLLAPNGAQLFELSWRLPPHMRFEPDALEALSALQVACAAPAEAVPVQTASLNVRCPFVAESVIWEHYELITREFYVHCDHEE